jgi:hypothetical protein
MKTTVMAAPTNMIHAHLPQVLFVRSDGSERKTAPAVSQMSEDEILTIEAIRDRLLDLYFPAAHKRSWQKVNYGIGVPNRETIYTFTAERNHDRKKSKPFVRLTVGSNRRDDERVAQKNRPVGSLFRKVAGHRFWDETAGVTF